MGKAQRAFLDENSIYRELLEYKALQHWNHLLLPKDSIAPLLANGDWYQLYIPKEELQPRTMRDSAKFQEIAVSLLKKYLDRLMDAERAEWENARLVVADIGPDDVDREYRFELEVGQVPLKKDLELLATAIGKGNLAEIDLVGKKISGATVVAWENLLYVPLLQLRESVLRLSKLALQESELHFVKDLLAFIESKPDILKDAHLYLLRNETKSKGIGFFDRGGFYPDFLLWIVRGDKQTVCFIDPHGMRNESPTSPKVELSKEIKTHETRLKDVNLQLESFIVTETPYLKTRLADAGWTKTDCEKAHVLFMEEASYIKKLFALAQ